MTTPAKKAAPAAKNTTVAEKPVEEKAVVPATETSVEVKPDYDERIPESLRTNLIFADFCKRYMGSYDEITEYNKEVLASKDSEWNAPKVIAEARKFASPTNTADLDPAIKAIVDEWDKATAVALELRKKVLNATSEKLGINLSSVADRDHEKEDALKEKRKLAIEIGKRMADIAGLTTDEDAGKDITDFLSAYGMPAVGRDQATTITSDGSSTPKYRVTVRVFNADGAELLNEKGFTKTVQSLTKPVFGYERGKSPKSEDLRKAWEAVGNNANETKQATVEFEDNNLKFIITKN